MLPGPSLRPIERGRTAMPHTPHKVEVALEKLIFSSRWLLVPFFLGLIVSIAVLLLKFFKEMGLLVQGVLGLIQHDTVISILTDAYSWVPGDADWDVGVPEVSDRESVQKARAHHDTIRKKQRIGV